MLLTAKNVFSKESQDQLRAKSQRPALAACAYLCVWVIAKGGLGILTIGASISALTVLPSMPFHGVVYPIASSVDRAVSLAVGLSVTTMLTNEIARVTENPKTKRSACYSADGVNALAALTCIVTGAASFWSFAVAGVGFVAGWALHVATFAVAGVCICCFFLMVAFGRFAAEDAS